MNILKAIYFVTRTWFDFMILLPTWMLLIEADKALTGSCKHVVPYTEDYEEDQIP